MSERYDADYFLRGRQTGKSLYEDYRWIPELTVPMVCTMISHLGIDPDDTILDFGCARGYVVRAFRELGYSAYGYDISEWAVENADPSVYHYLTRRHDLAFASRRGTNYDWIIAKDVLEHIPEVRSTICELMSAARKGVFIVVPLGYGEDGYVVPEYDLDVTHIHRLGLATWVSMFVRPGWRVEASYRVKGIKDNYAKYPMGNGFLTARRIRN